MFLTTTIVLQINGRFYIAFKEQQNSTTEQLLSLNFFQGMKEKKVTLKKVLAKVSWDMKVYIKILQKVFIVSLFNNFFNILNNYFVIYLTVK